MKNKFKKKDKRRRLHNVPKVALLIYALLGVFFGFLVLNFFNLMIVKSVDDVDLQKQAEAKYARHIEEMPDRGQILDRNGNMLAEDMEAYKIAVVVDEDYDDHIEDKHELASALTDVLGMEKKEITEIINQGIKDDKYQVEFGTNGTNISYKDKKSLEEKNLPGLLFTEELKRFYPNGVFASHLIGFAERDDSDNLKGSLGIEKEYDKELTGQNGHADYDVDSWNYIIPGTFNNEQAIDGMDVELTLDSNIQLYLEESLDDMDEYFEPEELFAFVTDAKTGEVLGAGQRPSFNPDTREGFGDSWLNMLYEYQFEPGSTFKMFSVAAAMEEGQYDPNEYFDSGSRDVMDTTIYDWEKEGWGEITYNEGLQYSSNVLMMDLMDKVGADKMLDYYKKFGFGEVTGSEFSTEAKGQIVWDDELQQKTSSFGQTISVTPVQMLQGFTALLNDGMMKQPYVIKSITDKENDEEVYRGQEKNVRQVISKDTAQKTMDEMSTLVGGSMDRNSMYQLDDYEVTGKSGTAQVFDEETMGYVDGDYEFLTSFIGYAPKDDPEVIIYYGVKRASKNKSDTWDNGVSLGFNPLMERTLKYLDRTNSEQAEDIETIPVEDFRGEKVSDVDVLQNDLLNKIYVGEGSVVKDHYPKNTEMLEGESIIIETDGEKTVPDFEKLSKREAIITLEYLGIEGSFKGEGYVMKQSVAPGEKLEDNMEIDFELDTMDQDD